MDAVKVVQGNTSFELEENINKAIETIHEHNGMIIDIKPLRAGSGNIVFVFIVYCINDSYSEDRIDYASVISPTYTMQITTPISVEPYEHTFITC